MKNEKRKTGAGISMRLLATEHRREASEVLVSLIELKKSVCSALGIQFTWAREESMFTSDAAFLDVLFTMKDDF